MGGFSDSIIVRTYSGTTRDVTPTFIPAFKIPKPDWYDDAKVTITADIKVSGSTTYPWLLERLASSGEILDFSDSYLYIIPTEISDWDNEDEYERYIVALYRRVISEQAFEPINLSQFDMAGLVDQLNKTTRLAQEAYELGRRAALLPPQDVPDFAGEEAILPGTYPPVNVRRGKIAGFHPTTGMPALFDAQGIINDPSALVVPKVELSGRQFFRYNSAGVVVDPTIELSMSIYGFIETSIEWSWSMDGTTWTVLPEILDQLTLTHSDYTDNFIVKGFASNGTNSAQDVISIVKVYDGEIGYTVVVDNQVLTVQCDSSGDPLSGEIGPSSDARFSVIVFRGGDQLAPVVGVPGVGEFRIQLGAPYSTYLQFDDANTLYLDDATAPGILYFDVNCEGSNVQTHAVSWSKSVQGATGLAGQSTPKYRGPEYAVLAADADALVTDTVLGDFYLWVDTASYVSGTGNSAIRSFDGVSWSTVSNPTSDQFSMAMRDVFNHGTFLEEGVATDVKSILIVNKLFAQFVKSYIIQFEESVGSTVGGGATPTVGDMLIYMGKDPRKTGTRPFEFALKEYIGDNGQGEIWMEHLITKFLSSGLLALALSGCVQATQVLSSPGSTWSEAESIPFGSSAVYSSAFGDGVICAVGDSGKLSVSTDYGKTWSTLKSIPFGSFAVRDVGFGNHIFVIVGDWGRMSKSTDYGVTWSSLITNPFPSGSGSITTIEYDGTTWVAGSDLGAIAYSLDDCVTWSTLISNPFATAVRYINKIKNCSGVLIAVGGSGGISRSVDHGATWSAFISSPFSNSVYSIAEGIGEIVLVGDSGAIAKSDDGGQTFGSLISTPLGSGQLFSVASLNGVFIVGGASGVLGKSIDHGETWTAISTEITPYGTSVDWTNIAESDQGFLMCGAGSSPHILYSKLLEAGGGVVGKGIEARGRYIDMSDGTRVWDTVNDSRITTGTVARTEEVLPLEVGQTADINWACGITGGTARVITFKVPASPGGATYQVNCDTGQDATNSMAVPSLNALMLASFGTVAAGTTVALASVSSGNTRVIRGTVKRIT